MAEAPTLPRGQLVQLIAGMVQKKGPAMEAELRRRIAVGEDLEVKGIRVDAALLKEALAKHEAQPSGTSRPSGGPPSAAPSAPIASKPSALWTPPPSKKASGARWTPGAPSASLLAARALQECEQAEVFCKSVQVVDHASVPLFAKPDVLSERTGESLSGGSVHEVVARFLSQKDGRTYLRLKCQTGWVSTRACDFFTTLVLTPLQGEPPLEPSRCNEPVESRAVEVLPLLDAADVQTDGGAEGCEGEPLLGCSQSEGEDAADEDDVDLTQATQATQEDAEAECEASQTREGEEEEEDEGEDDASDKENHNDSDDGLDSPKRKGPKKDRRFKVIIGRCPVLAVPDAAHLMAGGNKMMQQKEEFTADGALFVPAEQRTYLRLPRGRGWVCERSRNDLHRLAVVPITRRKKPISKKMAKVVVFRGGDTDGVTKLRKEDLVKNSAGKIVSKRASEAAKKRYADGIGKWTTCVKRAREELGLEGFVKVKKGTPVYEKAIAYYKQAGGGADAQ